MVKKVTVYYCDPEKNVDCSKTYCKGKGDAAKWPECEFTSHPEYAKTDADGKPLEYVYEDDEEDGITDRPEEICS